MPVVPSFTSDVRADAAAPALANPAAFGQAGEALARGAEQIGGTAEEFNQRYIEARRQADAANLVAGASQQLGDMQFRWSKVPDRQAAYAGFQKEAGDYVASLTDGIQDPLIKAHVADRVGQEAVIRGLDTQNAAFGLESAKQRGDLDLRLDQYAQSAAATGSDMLRAKLSDDATADIHGAVAAGWLRPDEGASRILAVRSQMAEVKVRQLMNAARDREDPDAADAVTRALGDPGNFPGLLPERREMLQQSSEILGYRLAVRDSARMSREEADAARELRSTQSQNETDLLAGVYNGKIPSNSMLEELARAQQISPAGLEAVHSAIDRGRTKAAEGLDDPAMAARLWSGAAVGGVTSKQDVYDALGRGQLKVATAAELMRTLNERDKQQESEVERGAFATLKTITSGAAVEQGLIKDDTVRAHAEQAWGQAQGEWYRRVIGGHEDPMAVLSDMAPRYASVMPHAPSWLPAAKFGAIASLDDVKRVYGATKQAFEGKQIGADEFDNQVRVLDAYRAFYAEKNIRDSVNVIPFRPGARTQPQQPNAGAGQ